MTDVEKECENRLSEILRPQAGVYLFIGAGLSRRYAGLPDWRGLLQVFAEKTKLPVEYYVSSVDGNLAAAAQMIADNFFEVWWESNDYRESVDHSKSALRGRQAPLKIEIANYLKEKVAAASVPSQLLEEYNSFGKIQVDAIITTNFDDMLSRVFPAFKVFVGQDELLFANPQGVAEIYQIHGSVSKPETLVLTDGDYADFNERNPYLAAKLITVFMEHPVIFLGYSLSDPNIRQIVRSVLRAIRPQYAERLRSRLIFVEWLQGRPPEISNYSLILDDDGADLPITRVTTDSFNWVYRILSERKRALPAGLLRQLKEQVYDLVNSDDPRRQSMYVKDLNEGLRSDSDDIGPIEIVLGVGARVREKGLVGLSRWDLVDDLLGELELNLDATRVLTDVIPRLVATAYAPVFKYLRASKGLEKLRNGETGGYPEAVIRRYKYYSSRFEALERPQLSVKVDELRDREDGAWIPKHAMELPRYTDDADGLRSFLVENRNWRNKPWLSTQYGKLAVVYDWMRNAGS